MVVEPWWFACCGMYKDKCDCPCVRRDEDFGESEEGRWFDGGAISALGKVKVDLVLI
jgi:hypothetical protein